MNLLIHSKPTPSTTKVCILLHWDNNILRIVLTMKVNLILWSVLLHSIRLVHSWVILLNKILPTSIIWLGNVIGKSYQILRKLVNLNNRVRPDGYINLLNNYNLMVNQSQDYHPVLMESVHIYSSIMPQSNKPYMLIPQLIGTCVLIITSGNMIEVRLVHIISIQTWSRRDIESGSILEILMLLSQQLVHYSGPISWLMSTLWLQ